MNYRIFNVRTWPFVCLRIHTGGLGTPTASQHNVHSEKLKDFLLLLTRRDSNPRSLDLQSNALTTEPTRHPNPLFNELASKLANQPINQPTNWSSNQFKTKRCLWRLMLQPDRSGLSEWESVIECPLKTTEWTSERQFNMVSMRSGKPIARRYHTREIDVKPDRMNEGPYALHPVSQQFPQCCPWNSSNIGLIDDGPFSSSERHAILSLPRKPLCAGFQYSLLSVPRQPLRRF